MATIAPTQTHGVARNRIAINRLGLWLFFLSECFLFGTIIATRYYIHGFETPDEVNQTLGLAITAILLLSSLSAYRAETAIAHGDHAGFRRNMVITILLGILFLVGVGIEWREAFEHFPPSTGYGTILFATTGIHAVHVFSGVILLTIILFHGRRPERFTQESHWGVEASVKYWHFVDVAWVFIYPTLYLVG